ncbi:hypothetical protein CL620_05250 [archaeon]|jgi:uncharacterized membrane protein|nr:hypothetical protein [archaeon]|tara:strand:- start:2619 stop:2930 length:312 start_codon:yes stop_codon:yes gene_type:complete
MSSQGMINIKLDGVSFEETEYFRKVIHTLFQQGVFNIKNGTATLAFNREGELASIELKFLKWRDKDPDKPDEPLRNPYEGATIETTGDNPKTLTSSKEREPHQ